MISATVVMDNWTDTARKYAVTADVTVNGEAISSVDSGVVSDPATGARLAEFSAYNPRQGQMNVNFSESGYDTAIAGAGDTTPVSRTEIMEAIESFMAAAAQAAEGLLNVEL